MVRQVIDDDSDESVEYEPEFGYAVVGFILLGAFALALYFLGVGGWWFVVGLALFYVVWWRYRWRYTGLRQRHRQAIRRAMSEALAKREEQEKEREEDH
jgi:O-antigen/teichoic acid export membrane protein